jgi:ABC-type multidrug transport system fused ATPase/permease subunit
MKNLKKILDLLSIYEKKRAAALLILILCMAFIDVLGVASIMPFMAVLANPDLILTNPVLKYFYNVSSIFGIDGTKQFIFFFGTVVFFLLITSVVIRAVTHYAQLRFALMREYTIGSRLIESYLHQPYVWFLQRNSADFGKQILSEVQQVIYETMLPMISLFSQGLVALTLLLLIFAIDPKLALIIGITFSISYGVIFYFVKNILSKIGSERLRANEERFISINEAFGSIKEVQIGRLEKNYIDRFKKPAEIFARCQSASTLISQMPRYFIEGISFGGIVLLLLILIANGNLFSDVVSKISVYVFAGYRLIPCMQQIYVSFTQLRVSQAGLNVIHKDLMSLKSFDKFSETISATKLIKSIELSDISFDYPNNQKAALKNINLSIPAFSKVGFVGVTGSGKTTIIDLILGLLDPSQGTLKVDGNIINSNNKKSWQKSIGYVPQQVFLIDSSVKENIAFGVNPKNIDNQAVEWASKIANLHSFVMNELPNNYNTIVGERGVRLSGGQRQRIAIARALYHKPQVLILDEATSALDGLTEQSVIEALKNLENKITTILVTHRLSVVKDFDIIFLLEQGELKAQGSYEELRQFSTIFKKMSKTI